MRWNRFFAFGLIALLGLTIAAACDSSDDSERLAAQRLFRNVLLVQDPTAVADVRIEALVDDLPPDFPVPEGLQLLGSAFSDTDSMRQLIVGWQSTLPADDIFEFYSRALDEEPWSIRGDPRVAGVDFIDFRDSENAAFVGELRIAQEGNDAVVILISREFLNEAEAPATGS